MIKEKIVKLTEEQDSQDINTILNYRDSTLSSLMDERTRGLIFSGRAWGIGFTLDELREITNCLAYLEADLENKRSNKDYWIQEKNLLGLDPKEIKQSLQIIKFIISAARARRKELREVYSIFIRMLVEASDD